MQYSLCQRDVIYGACFCNHCGYQVQERCSIYRTLNPLGSKYCHSCRGEILEKSKVQEEVLAASENTGEYPTSVESQMWPRCHSNNELGSQYCFHCGLALKGASG